MQHIHTMHFEELNLNKPLLNALNDLGLEEPTRIQQEVFNPIMSGKDIVGVAQTGTGKTFAYLLPCLRLWKYSKSPHPSIVIIVPTRELVAQVVEQVEKLTTYMNLVVGGAYGGVNIKRHIELVNNGLDVLVATPGRLHDLYLKGSLKYTSLRHLIIDEVDEMLDLGFRPQLLRILDYLPERRQNLLFSATMTSEVDELINTFFYTPIKIEAARRGTPLEQIEQFVFEVPNFYTKVNLLQHLLSDGTMDKVLVFASSKKLADQLFSLLEPDFGEAIGIIHSNKSQNFRFRSVTNFHEGIHKILIATDIVARGIDISEVTHVINLDIPEVPENYIHRIGRTGRADKKGISYSFCTPKEEVNKLAIEILMDKEIDILSLPEEVEISEELTEDEIPKVKMPDIIAKNTRRKPKFDPSKQVQQKKIRSTSNRPQARRNEKKGKKKGR